MSPQNPLDQPARDTRRESIWRRLLEIDDELADLEKAERIGMQALDSALQENIARLKRQRKQYERACEAKTRTDLLPKPPSFVSDEMELCVPQEPLNVFKSYVTNCGEEWTKHIVEKFDNHIRRALAVDFATPPNPPAAMQAPTNRVKLHHDPPKKPLYLPGTGELILRFWSANKEISILPTAILGLGSFAIVAYTEKLSQIRTDIGALFIFLVLGVFGWAVATKERRKLVREARDVYETTVLGFVKAEVTETLQEHEESLARWMQSRTEAWKQALVKHHEAAFLEKNKQSLRDKRRDLVIEKKGLEEKERELEGRH